MLDRAGNVSCVVCLLENIFLFSGSVSLLTLL